MCQGANKGRWWVMEQQPGPVNWAQWNPAPLDGMVRLWTWQAFAHGAEVVSYFRWRQAPFAQEQMHAGLNRPDRSLDQGGLEAKQVFAEVRKLGLNSKQNLPLAPVESAQAAIIFDYPSIWMAQIQPQGADFNAIEIAFRAYSAMRCLGLDVDIISSKADVSAYQLVVLPAHMREDSALAQRLQTSGAQIVFGPRSGSKGQALAFPDNLPPGAFSILAGVQVQRVASLPPGLVDTVLWTQDDSFEVTRWREDLALSGATAVAHFSDGQPAITRHGAVWYCAGWPAEAGWMQLISRAAQAADLATQPVPADVRISRKGDLAFVQNFSSSTVDFSPSTHAHCLLGARELAPQGLAIWKLTASA